MNKVYFKKIEDFNDKELINKTCYEMLELVIKEENIKLEPVVPLKVHFGEKGNNTFITPDNFNGIKKYLKDNNIKSCYMDTNVLYKGSRTETKNHINTALDHGFTDLEIIIADGDEENPYQEIEINKKHFNKCKIGTKYSHYNNYIVLAHFKGHMLAGIGASIKQLAMGFASRGGKLHQHSESIPIINKDKCVSCGNCVDICPVNAITMPDKAKISPDVCIGCAACTIACPVNAINNTWNSSNFHEKLAEYAYAAALNKKNIYFNFAYNITKDCDCVGHKMDKIATDIGIFASTNPVAIDNASLDIFEKINTKNSFEVTRKTIDYAEEIGLGSKDYELTEI